MITPDEVHARIVALGEDWADKDGAASALEETRRTLRAQLAVHNLLKAGSVSKAELLAEADDRYIEHVTKMVDARKAANIAKVRYDSGRAWVDLVRTEAATRRAEMGMR